MSQLFKRRIAALALWPLLVATDALVAWTGVDTWPALRAASAYAFNLMWGSKP